MKTFFIDGNSMHLAGSQIDISDNFFGSESPESNATDSQHKTLLDSASEKWMIWRCVIWDGVRIWAGGTMDKMKG